ncbi:MAG: DUF3006 domain-containing protein [Clostridia bacterium]|nr:DUF3006 domain-containing protein [Clostridia bacterium]
MTYFVLDRFEGEFALCEDEDGNMKRIGKSALPQNIKEGDVLRFDGCSYVFDAERTKERQERIRKLLSRLKRK